MQRLHVDDISGVILKLKMPYIHLRLPMEFEVDARCETPIGCHDPRREEGELLFPQRFPCEVVERDKASLGPYGIAGQLQQRPHPREGAIFKRGWFEIVPAAPSDTKWVRHWDLAGSKPSGSSYRQAWTAGVKLGRAPNGVYYVAHVIRFRDEGNGVRMAIKTTAQAEPHVNVSLSQDPGQAGKVQAQDMITMLDGFRVCATVETGSKRTRAEPFQAQAAAGNVKLVHGDWNEDYLDELVAFPGPTNDQVDATSGAYARLQQLKAVDKAFHFGVSQIDRGPCHYGVFIEEEE